MLNFIKVLKKNKLHFIEKEYVIFYELDITTIHGLNNNIHKSKKWVKYLNSYWVYIYNNVIVKTHSKIKINNKYYYIIFFLKKYNKIIKVKNNIWKSLETYKIITFHHKNKKLNITVKNAKKILITLSSGISIKKLGLEEKKNKKSLKVFNIMIKSILNGLKPLNFFLKCIIQFRGTNNFINKYIDYINQLNFKFFEVYYIYTPIIPNKPRFKKVRSLKKNFRKNFLKVF